MGNPSANLLYPVVNKEVAFLGEGHDIVTRETCIPTSLNVNNLGKAAVLHFASHSLLWLGPHQTQPVDHWAQLCLMSISHGLLIIHSPHLTVIICKLKLI
jgi:hypothetical protein